MMTDIDSEIGEFNSTRSEEGDAQAEVSSGVTTDTDEHWHCVLTVTDAGTIYVRYFWWDVTTTGAMEQAGGWSVPFLEIEAVPGEIFDVLQSF